MLVAIGIIFVGHRQGLSNPWLANRLPSQEMHPATPDPSAKGLQVEMPMEP